MRTQKVTTTAPLSPSQSQELQRLGCEAKPFLDFKTYLVWCAAEPTEENVEALRALKFVESVVDMPTYTYERWF